MLFIYNYLVLTTVSGAMKVKLTKKEEIPVADIMRQGRISHEVFEVSDGAGSGLQVKANYNLTKCLAHVLTL